MRVKVVSIMTCLVLCTSLALILAPPLARPVEANPMQTLNLNISAATAWDVGNMQQVNLQPGDQIIQFTRPNLIVGTNPRGGISTLLREVNTVSGDLSGTIVFYVHRLSVSWDGLSRSTGYAIMNFTFDDGAGSTFSGFQLCDVDDPPPNSMVRSYVASTSGTGVFAGQILIGSGIGDPLGGGGGTMTLRRYSASEISSQPCSAAGTWTAGNGGLLGPYTSQPLPSDDFVQFTRSNISIPAGSPTYYGGAGHMTGSVTVGTQSGTFTQSWNNMSIPGTTPSAQGWNVGKQTMVSPNGTLNSVYVLDSLGITPSGSLAETGYAISLKENDTGSFAGSDYFAAADVGVDNPVSTSGTLSVTGTMYTLSSPGVPVATATHTGTATFYSDNGTIQNLQAVSLGNVPPPPITNPVFPDGLFSFDITGVTPNGSVTVTIELPSGIPANAGYYKYDSTNGWSQIGYTVVNAHEISITLSDDGRNGDQVAGDGIINDPGGLGGPGPSGPGGGTSAPVFPSIYIGIGAALGAGIVAYAVRRRLARQ